MEQAVHPLARSLWDREITQIAWAAFHGRLALNLPEDQKQDAIDHPAHRQT